jgi:transcriptional regulator with XRE-family HTH domain
MATPLKDRIRALRKAAGLTVEQLAQCAGLSDSLISKLESGARGDGLTADAALSLSEALGCSVEHLVRGDDDVNPTVRDTLVDPASEIDALAAVG